MLESIAHEDCSFVTLTYNDDNVPEGSSLVPRDLQLFLKRLRHHVETPFRYFACGEYGDITERPHYHLALFGVAPSYDPQSHPAILSSWDYGYHYSGTLTIQSAHYIAGYVTKKLTSKYDPRLHNRHPEFARMSLRPGIGALSASDIARAIAPTEGFSYYEHAGDVPSSLSHGRSAMPLGRYMRARIRTAVGYDDPAAESERISGYQKQMQALWATRYAITEDNTIKEAIQTSTEQKIRQLTAKYKIYNTGKKQI